MTLMDAATWVVSAGPLTALTAAVIYLGRKYLELLERYHALVEEQVHTLALINEKLEHRP